jgi:hypothetical protein
MAAGNAYRPPPGDQAISQWLSWCTAEIRRQPLTALTLGATAGFILGGGMRSHAGRKMLAFVGTSLARTVVTELATELLRQNDRDSVGTSNRVEAGAF